MIRKAALLTALTATLLAPHAAVAEGAAAAKPAKPRPADAAERRQNTPLVITSITPDVPRERTTEIKVSATFTNTGNAPLYNLRMRLRTSPNAFGSRQEMAAYQSGEAFQRDRASLSNSVYITSLGAGETFSHEFVVSPAKLEQYRWGVYPLAVEVVNALGQTLGIQRTFLPYAPRDTKVARSRLSVVLPLVDVHPRRDEDGVFLDDGLREAVSDKGRLATLLTLVERTSSAEGVTWMVDPSLLDDVRRTTEAYRVRSGGGTRERDALPASAPWLERLREALADTSVFATPYADPDIAALVHNRMDDAPAAAMSAAAETGRALLDRDVPTDVAWPVNGVIDHDGLDALAGVGVNRVLLDERNLPPATSDPAGDTGGTGDPTGVTTGTTTASATPTPDAVTSLTTVYGEVTAVVADPVLSQLLGRDVSAPGSAVLARQRFIAETAMIAAEAPRVARNLAMAPHRRWTPNPEYVTDLLETAASLPWLKLTPITSLEPPKKKTPRADLTYTDQHRRAELPRDYLKQVRRVAAQAELTTAVITGDKPQRFEDAVLRLASSGWRSDLKAAKAAADRIDDVIDRHISRVSITGTEQPRTLAGQEGVVPISVHNASDETVSLRVEVKPTDRRLLKIEPYDPAVLIGPGQSQPVQVPLSAPFSGETTINVQLRTEDGRKYGPPVELTVRTTGYTGIALVIVGGALSVMLAAVTLRVLRRRRKRTDAAQQTEATGERQGTKAKAHEG